MIRIPREQKMASVESLRAYLKEEREEEWGQMSAESLFDFMLTLAGPYVYNHAVNDARKLLQERMMTLEDDLYALEKPLLPKPGR